MADEKILLNKFRNVNAVNEDLSMKMSLLNDREQIIEYDITNVLNVTQVYEIERQDVDTYRFYGKIEYLSPINNMITTYDNVKDFFTIFSSSATTKSILSDFKFYLLAPTTAYTELISGTTGGTYIKNYEVLSEINKFEIYRAGYSLNLFDETQYIWDFNMDFNIKNRYDGLNFPLTELYLYAQYQPQINGSGETETMSGKTYDLSGNTIIGAISATTLTTGNTVVGDVIKWDKFQFSQETINSQEYYITTYCNSGGTNIGIVWKYSPIIPITIRNFEDNIERVNISGTSYENIILIPPYATKIDNEGNYLWRNLQDKGFIDPLTGEGTSYPFVNQRHYVFKNIVLAVKPDLNNLITRQVFNEILFIDDTFISARPNSNLNQIGKPCNL